MIPALTAISSLASQNLGGQSVTPNGTATGVDFGSVMAQVTQNAVGKLKSAEATAISGMQGQASVQQVVQTVMDAQSSLQTAIAVRDKLVSAYQELNRMAI